MSSSTLSGCESDCDSYQSEVDFYAFDMEDQDVGNFSDSAIHPVLMNDIRLLQEHCPTCNVCHRSLDRIHEMDLDISFPTTLLEKIVAEAWGFIHGEPVVIRLSVDQKFYLDVDVVNRVEVFQKGSSKKSGVLMQLKTIVEEFCRRQFRELTNGKVQVALEGDSNNCRNISSPEMLELFEMGFKQGDIVQAYRFSDGTKEGAINFLLERQVSREEGTSFVADRNDVAQGISPPLPQNAKVIPSLSKGFLVQLYLYIEQRLLTLNSFCPVCDNSHSTTICMMLKPVVCSNPLCIFSYQTLGVMADAAEAIVSEPEVVTLLIYLTKAAVQSKRNELILTPYPTVVHPGKVNEMALHPGKKNFKLLNAILAKIPHIQDILKHDEAELRNILNDEHELCYPLLRWIVSSNRSYIVKLLPNMQLSFMGTKHQFLMRNSPPLEDRQFRLHREEFGSVFAFHGSPIENWHSIVREGLIVASGTNKMIHGSAYGNGIYLSPHLGTSIGYCMKFELDHKKEEAKHRGETSVDYIQGQPESLTCITLCEVIDCPSLKKFGSIWTCDKSEYVCTRFFFVYDKFNLTASACLGTRTTNSKIRTEIKMAIAAYGDITHIRE